MRRIFASINYITTRCNIFMMIRSRFSIQLPHFLISLCSTALLFLRAIWIHIGGLADVYFLIDEQTALECGRKLFNGLQARKYLWKHYMCWVNTVTARRILKRLNTFVKITVHSQSRKFRFSIKLVLCSFIRETRVDIVGRVKDSDLNFNCFRKAIHIIQVGNPAEDSNLDFECKYSDRIRFELSERGFK